jgi:hypothetical protein
LVQSIFAAGIERNEKVFMVLVVSAPLEHQLGLVIKAERIWVLVDRAIVDELAHLLFRALRKLDFV